MKKLIKQIHLNFLNILFPPRCIICGKFITKAYGFCTDCEILTPKTEGTKEEHKFGDGKLQYVDFCASPFYYENGIRKALIRMKFQGKCAFAEAFADPMMQAFTNAFKNKAYPRAQAISWVPISVARSKERGYDQSKLLANHLGRIMDLPVLPTLKKVVNNPMQSSLKAKDRKGNVLGVYELDREFNAWTEMKAIILVDDIFTTGATINEAAKIIKAGGAENIYALFAAKTRASNKSEQI